MQKEFLQLSRDRALLPILFIMPILQLVFFGYVVGLDVRNLQTAMVDEDGTAISHQLADAFSGSAYFTIVARPSAEASVQPLMDGSTAQVAIVIPKGFATLVRAGRAAPLEIVVDGSDSKVSQVAAAYSQQIVADVSRTLYASNQPAAAVASIDTRVRVLYNPSLASVNVMVPALMAFILQLSTMLVMSQAVVRERERGNLEQLFTTPIRRSEYLVGKIAPYMAVAVVQVTAVFTVGTLLFGVPFNGSLAVIALGLGLFMFTTVGLGLFISTISHTRQQAQQATIFVLLPSIVLSGFIFPIESMPPAIQLLTYVIPLRYIVVIMRSNFLKGASIAQLWPQFLGLTIFAVAVFGASLSRFRKRLAD
jgi:ABC-2 type transport system permease protein